jgi:hypothetical protein
VNVRASLRDWWTWLRYRIGRRGAFLGCMAAYDLAYGAYLALGYPVRDIPLIGEQPWGWMFISAGLILGGGAWARWDAPYYAVAISIKIVWALEFFRLEAEAKGTGQWLRGCYWLALSLAVLVAAWWPEPPRASPTGSEAEQRAREA